MPQSRMVEDNGQALFEPESLTSEFLGADNTTGEGAEFSQVVAYWRLWESLSFKRQPKFMFVYYHTHIRGLSICGGNSRIERSSQKGEKVGPFGDSAHE